MHKDLEYALLRRDEDQALFFAIASTAEPILGATTVLATLLGMMLSFVVHWLLTPHQVAISLAVAIIHSSTRI